MPQLGNISIDANEIVDHLQSGMKLKSVVRQVLYCQVIRAAARDRNLDISEEEIQEEADRFRHQHKLESAADTFSWLEEQMMTPDDWKTGIFDQLLRKKLAEHLFGNEVETYFAQNKVQYEQAILYRILVPYRALAQELLYEIEEEEISFFEAAHLYDLDERRRLTCGFEGKVSRWKLKPDLAAKVFAANPREVVEPIQTDAGFELLMVEEFIAAELTPETRQQILDKLFQEWLESELNYLIHAN